MRRTIVGLIAFVMICATFSTRESEAGNRRRERRRHRDACCCPAPTVRTAVASYYVCPVYPYAFHGTYTSYYALAACDFSRPMSLDTANNTPTDGCSNHWHGCTYVPLSLPPEAKAKHPHPEGHSNIKSGIPDYPTATTLVDDGTISAKPVSAPVDVEFDDAGTLRKAKLMEVAVTYRRVTMPTSRIGYEIDPASVTTGRATVLDRDDHSYYLKYRGKQFHVMLKR